MDGHIERMTSRGARLIATLLAAMAAAPGVADAAYPGANGKIAFATENGIAVVGPDGRGFQRLSTGNDRSPAWSADGRRIAFERRTRGGGSDVWVMDAGGAHQRRVTRTPGAERHPTWSPDGTRIAYGAASGIYVTAASGGPATFVVDGANPSWSPDGSRIAYTSEAVVDGDYPMGPHGGVWTVAPDGGGAQRVRMTAYAADPDWSPDATRIALDLTVNEGSVAWMAADGSGDEHIFGASAPDSLAGYPGWSPDGRYIAFARATYAPESTHGSYSIGIENVATGTARYVRVKGARTIGTPDWQPATPGSGKRR
jgi:Tol biopolymer transport system component